MSIDTSKIIHGVVGGGRYTVTAPIVKEDYGLYLLIEGLELPSTYEVDFSNSEHNGTSVTMIGNADGVLIPSQFISSGKDVFAFLYHVGVDFGRTVYKFRIPNKLRPDRTNEQPTPEEQSVIDQAIAALNDAVEQTAQDVIDADESAQSAQGYAEQAETARDAAQTYANNAQTSANNASASASQASASATASAQSASQSAQIKADVEDLVDDAQTSASASAQSASASANSASQALSSAQSASASASSAQGYASQAQTSAQTASSKATEASGYASTASAKATESAQSATNAQGYAQTAEQAKTASQTAQGLAESARDLAQGYAEDAQGYANDAQASAEGISASASQIAKNSADILKAFPTDTASGAVASFSDGADGIPLKSLIVNIDPVQDTSSGDPSPTNICPISGWTSVQANQSGVNVWDEEWELVNINWSTSVFIPATNGGRLASKNYIPVVEGNYYCNYNRAQTFLAGYTDDNGNGGRTLIVNSNTNIVAIPSDVHFIKFGIATSYYGTTYNHDISINYPSTDHSYHPYTGRSINIQLGQTVYDGKLDVLNGELVIDRAMVDLGTLTWTIANAPYRIYNATLPSGMAVIEPPYTNRQKGVICSHYGASATVSLNDSMTDKSWLRFAKMLYIRDTDYAGVASFKSAMSGVECVYPLDTPIEIQLTSNQINSLLGVNNIWADSGDTEVEYRADTKLYINKKIAEAISALS